MINDAGVDVGIHVNDGSISDGVGIIVYCDRIRNEKGIHDGVSVDDDGIRNDNGVAEDMDDGDVSDETRDNGGYDDDVIMISIVALAMKTL